MTLEPRRIAGAFLAAAVFLAAAISWSGYRGAALLARARELGGVAGLGESVRGETERGDSVRVDAERIVLLRRALAGVGVASEARTVLALELIKQAQARVASEPADGPWAGDRTALHRDALREVLLALRANPTSTKAWLAGYRVVESARVLGRQAEIAAPQEPGVLSRRFVEGAIRADPNGGEFHHDLAALLLANGRRSEAFEHYRRAARDLFFDADAIATEMFDAGVSPDQVLSAMPDSYEGQITAARLLQSRDRTDLAERALLRAASLSRTPWEAWTSLSRLEEGAGRRERALAYARSALELLPELPAGPRSHVLFRAAEASYSSGHREEARTLAERALGQDPANLYACSLLGTILLDQGDPAGALHQWLSLVENHGDDPYVSGNLGVFHRMIGRAYEKLGLRDRAVEHYARAIAAVPDDGESKAALARLRDR